MAASRAQLAINFDDDENVVALMVIMLTFVIASAAGHDVAPGGVTAWRRAAAAGNARARQTAIVMRMSADILPRTMRDEFMQAAIDEAEAGRREGGIPIGSVIVHGGAIIGRGHNRRVQRGSAVLHGEMDALENAGRQPASVYRESVLYTTLSPCAMCSGAILLYGIPHVVIGENRTFLGEEELLQSRGVKLEVLNDETCIEMMTSFIREETRLWNVDIGE